MFHAAVRAVILAAICGVMLGERAGADFRPGTFSIQSVAYQDLDGDHDTYPDTGETGRVVLTIMNVGPAIGGVIATISTDDPEVACLIDRSVLVGDLEPGQVVTLGSLDPGVPGFTFRASDALQSTGLATITLCLRITWNGKFMSGFGLIDEVAEVQYYSGYYGGSDHLNWSYLPLTTSYQVAMSSRMDHGGPDCPRV